jgi:hypothetical protein
MCFNLLIFVPKIKPYYEGENYKHILYIKIFCEIFFPIVLSFFYYAI